VKEVSSSYPARPVRHNGKKNRVVFFAAGTGNPYFRRTRRTALQRMEIGRRDPEGTRDGPEFTDARFPNRFRSEIFCRDFLTRRDEQEPEVIGRNGDFAVAWTTAWPIVCAL